MRRKIIEWLIGKFLPNHHLSRNPPKGIKRPRRLPEGNDVVQLPDPDSIFKE